MNLKDMGEYSSRVWKIFRRVVPRLKNRSEESKNKSTTTTVHLLDRRPFNHSYCRFVLCGGDKSKDTSFSWLFQYQWKRKDSGIYYW